MRIPPPPYLRLHDAFHRGDHLTVLAEGDAVAATLAGLANPDRETEGWLADTALMLGGAHAAYERAEVACTYLEHGLAEAARLDRSAPPPSAATIARRNLHLGQQGPPPPVAATPAGPFGAQSSPAGGLTAPIVPTRTTRSRATGSATGSALRDWAELLLLELSEQLGRYDLVLERVTRLLDPNQPTTTRFAATRAQATIAALRGDDETAHFLLNTATGLAQRIPSRYRVALVEGDRAMVLAGQGRTYEATMVADRVLGSFVRPVVGEYQLWSNAEGAAIALTLSRVCAHEGDQLTAQRMLRLGQQAAAPLGRKHLDGHVALAEGVCQAAVGEVDLAEGSLVTALRTFNTYGYRPAAAITLLEQARLAHARGLVRSARPLYEQALDDLRDLGQPREVRLARRLLEALDAGRPPSTAVDPASGSRYPVGRPFP